MLSLVIPIFNEEKLIDDLLKRSLLAIASFTSDYEVILVNDGSTDRSLERMVDWQGQNERIKILSLSKNFGHQAAYTAGLEYARGDLIAMMDGDLQDPPELIPELCRKITDEGYDVVNGYRTARKGRHGKILSTLIFHMIFRNIAEIKDITNAGNYSVMTRKALDAMLMMKEKVRYLPGIRAFIGFRQGYVEYVRDERLRGKSKMDIRKLYILAADAIFSFSRFPIRLLLILGMIGTIVFLGAGIYVLVAKAYGFAVVGWSSTLLSIYFLGSIQLVFMGILGEYIFRSYKESQNRPIYFIDRIWDSGLEKK